MAAFKGHSYLGKITIPESVVSIGQSAFAYCERLWSVTISSSVTSIENNAFDSCYNLSTVNYTGTEEQWGQITIGTSNNKLTKAKINYNYTSE